MIALDQALDRLLHRKSYRRLLLEGRALLLEISSETLEELRSIDARSLTGLAKRIATLILTRAHSGGGSILDLYPRTVAAFSGAEAQLGLAYAFMESPAFETYREIPFSGTGFSLEEAFYRFAESENIGDASDRELEFHAAMMKLLAVSPCAAITLPDCVRRTARGFFCVSGTIPAALHAVVSGQLVTGLLTPFLAELLVQGSAPATVAARHGVSTAVLRASVQRLSDLGILES